jgi:uncharacterized repeat protein (TIGR03803 family)
MAPAQAQTSYSETVLHSFAPDPPRGSNPWAGVIRDEEGNLYGTTPSGGAWGAGVVYKVDTAGHATVLYHFRGQADGDMPYGGLLRDPAGNLYGTTQAGGITADVCYFLGYWSGCGVVFKVDPAGNETVLYTFTGGADGAGPQAGVVADAAGNLYGTTQYGGASGYGTVYKLNTAGQETVLYSFTGGADGSEPEADVILDPAGNIYGTTPIGGTENNGAS